MHKMQEKQKGVSSKFFKTLYIHSEICVVVVVDPRSKLSLLRNLGFFEISALRISI